MLYRLASSTLAFLLVLIGGLDRATAEEPTTSFVYVCRDAGAGGYQAFPDICRLGDGRLMCIFYASYHHIGLPRTENPLGGRISYCLSDDEGHSWSEPAVLFDGPDDERDPSIVRLNNGRLICNYFSLHRVASSETPCPNPFDEPYTGRGTWIITSDDDGATWATPRKVYDEYTSSPIRELSGGRLIMPLYAEVGGERPSICGAVGISDDGGETWSSSVKIDNAGLPLDAETDVIELTDGRLWAALRSSHSPACFAISTDRGDTWSVSEPMNFVAHCPYLFRPERGGPIWLGYRGYKTLDGTGQGFTGLRCSTDECKTWSDPIVVDPHVGAYPSMVRLKDGSVLIVYYEEGSKSSIRARRFCATPTGTEWLDP